ncbi:Arc family DNA-binding protein [Thiothrix sp.]|uniref:Arc family DNA-binding protein n=1 Tax=Thiothrix sp. TaxID=1032 RepID=UPI00338F5805
MARENVTQTQVRLPNELLDTLKASAEKSLRSLNAEIIYQLQAGIGITSPHATPEEIRLIIREELTKACKP